jgi:hypothetical protein
MPVPFTFRVPADLRYRPLGPAVAAKYAELSGGSATDGTAIAESLTTAMDSLVDTVKKSGGVSDPDLELSFRIVSHAIEVTVDCEGKSTVVTHRIHAPKH